MAKQQRGNPIIGLRLPEWQIEGLKLIARQENTTISEIIRRFVAAFLAEHGITEQVKPIDGQSKLDV